MRFQRELYALHTEMWDLQEISQRERSFGEVIRAQQLFYTMPLTRFRDGRHGIRTICETGFFHGISAAMWLTFAPNAVLHSFELDPKPKAVQFLQARFGDRFRMHVGDSQTSIMRDLRDVSCDVMHVDGGHAGWVPYTDLQSFATQYHDASRASGLCRPNIVFADDTFACDDPTWYNLVPPLGFDVRAEVQGAKGNYCEVCGSACPCYQRGFCNDCSRSWARAEEEAVITSYGCVPLGFQHSSDYPNGFCVGEVPCKLSG